MTKLNLIQQSRLPKEEEFLWRYIDIHKFLNLMKQKRFSFTRMDQFEDALEGVPFETLQRFADINKGLNLNLANMILNPNEFILRTENMVSGRLDAVLQIQSSNFVSCWFYEQRESMAMWNLYSNPDGVAIKIPFGKLKSLLKPEKSKIAIKEYYCGKVTYQDFKQTDPYSENGLRKLGKVALRKDMSFSHEKEIRFVIKSADYKNMQTAISSEPIVLKDLEMQIVCHPRMIEWKKKNIHQILKDARLSKSYAVSEITLR